MYGEAEEVKVECETCRTIYIKGKGHCEFHLRLICSWCSKPQGYKPCEEGLDGMISHTTCPSCAAKFRAEMEKLP